ncbi:amidohydrolase family protein [Oscillatoria amoena NRMC-F 0135]|nr:amidohydrolase family protein [Oscillatoria amoena NRMC-F 0135]
MKKILLILSIAGTLASCRQHPVADQVVFGKTWTANEFQPWAEGFAIVDDSIVAVGSRKEIEKWVGKETRVTEASPDNLIVPGFIDSHTHFVDGGFALASVQLRDAGSKEAFVQRIADFAKTQPKGTWILNGDWDHENWGGELPSRDWIDAVTPDHPVWINRLDGHMCLANSAALKAAGITDRVMDVPGGTIVRDKKGRLTGIFKDNAMGMLYEKVPAPSVAQEDRALEAAMNYVAARGVTSIHNMSGYMNVFERAKVAGTLKTRIYAGMSLVNWKTLNEKVKAQGWGDKWLRVGGLKEFVDGSLGSHTAAFF